MDKKERDPPRFHRRELLAGAAYLMLGLSKAHATMIVDHLPWTPDAGNPPTAAVPGAWLFFTGDEGRAIEALADCVIPPDPVTPGGRESGSAVFIDRQLAGPYGRQCPSSNGLGQSELFRDGGSGSLELEFRRLSTDVAIVAV